MFVLVNSFKKIATAIFVFSFLTVFCPLVISHALTHMTNAEVSAVHDHYADTDPAIVKKTNGRSTKRFIQLDLLKLNLLNRGDLPLSLKESYFSIIESISLLSENLHFYSYFANAPPA